MPTKPEAIIKLKTGTLKIWPRGSGEQIVFAVMRGNKDVLRGTVMVKDGKAELFLGSADHTRTISAERIINEAIPKLKSYFTVNKSKSGIRELHWHPTRKERYGIKITTKNPRPRRRLPR